MCKFCKCYSSRTPILGHIRDVLPEKADRPRERERVKEEIDVEKFKLIAAGKESSSEELRSIEEIYGELNNPISIDKNVIAYIRQHFLYKNRNSTYFW